MLKFLLLLGLLPLIGSFLIRRFFSERLLKSDEGSVIVSVTGKEIAEKLFKKGKASAVEIRVKRRPFLPLSSDHLVLSPRVANSKEVRDVAEAALLAGIVLMARQQERVVAWRTWAVKFGFAMPGFAIVVMVFAMVIGRVTPSMSLAIVSACLGLSTILLWFTLTVERAAAKIVGDYLEQSALVRRSSEAELLAKFVKAHSWQRIVPGAVGFL